MYSDPEIFMLLVVLLTSVVSSVAGFALGSWRKREELAQARDRLAEVDDDRLQSVLDELRDVRAHVADLTLMVDDSQPRRSRSDALPGDE